MMAKGSTCDALATNAISLSLSLSCCPKFLNVNPIH